MTEPITVIGVLGAGRAGTALARVADSCGIEVDIAATRTPVQLKYHLAQYAPRARAVNAEEIGERAQIVVLMVPQEDLDDVDAPTLAGTVLVDATNRWQQEPVPRWLQAHLDEGMSSSEAIATRFSTARVVKALNHLSHWDLDAPDRATASPRRGLLVASDDDAAAALVSSLITQLGYDPVHVPRLHKGRIAEPGGPLFNRPMTAAQIREVL